MTTTANPSRNTQGKLVTPSKAKPELLQAAQVGYSEAIMRKPLDYDRYGDQHMQANYELGRQWAMNIRMHSGQPPLWQAGRTLPVGVDRALVAATRALGRATPRNAKQRADYDRAMGVAA